MRPRFLDRPDETGLVVHDPIHKRRYRLSTPDPVAPEPVDPPTDRFHFPVTTTARITTDRVDLSGMVATVVRDTDGDMIQRVAPRTTTTFEPGSYLLELTTPIKLYLRFDGPVTVESGADHVTYDFGGPTAVDVGARSLHEQPAGTITTPATPVDLLAAVSQFGGALKTTSCERSWPTLRGHPPAIEVGGAFDVPDHLDAPETGVTITVPPAFRSVYAVAPLAYYLGATLEPSAEPALRAGTVDRLLGTGRAFERSVNRLLKRTLFLDSVVRTEGYYPVPHEGRTRLEERVAFDPERLYGRSLADRLERYLEVPFEAFEDLLPRWRLGVVAPPEPGVAELLPYVAHGLALVEGWRPRSDADADPAVETAISKFVRGPDDDPSGGDSAAGDDPAVADGAVPGATGGGDGAGPATPVRRPAEAPSRGCVDPDYPAAIEQLWAGSAVPLRGGQLLAAGFEHSFESNSPVQPVVHVVCNDRTMSAELADPLYGDRADLEFTVRSFRNLSVVELRDLLYEECDFFHYVGHAEDGAFVCDDGKLDPGDLARTGVDAFLLNGCRSYEMGVDIVRAGGVGGVVTLQAVGNESAVRYGRQIARLLNAGFALGAAAALAADHHLVSHDYLVVGNPGADVARTEAAISVVCDVERAGPDTFAVEFVTYPAPDAGMGSLVQPNLSADPTPRLSGGTVGPVELSTAELREYFAIEPLPVLWEDELTWSTEVEL